MTRIVFDSYIGRFEQKFTCTNCQKKRKRVFTREHTVNPFNKDENGQIKTWVRVQREAQEAASRDAQEFMAEPWCSTCEYSLDWNNRKSLLERRRGRPI